jgi:hypothetical protein
VRAFLRRKHYRDEVRIIVSDRGEDLDTLLIAVRETGATAVAVPDLSHIDYQLSTLGAYVDVWATVSGQFWQKLQPDQTPAQRRGGRQVLGWITNVASAIPSETWQDCGAR